MKDFILTVLAIWRLSHLITTEEGPYSIFSKIRYSIGVRQVPIKGTSGDIHVMTTAQNTWAYGITCLWCTSIWASLFFVIFGKVSVVKLLRMVLAGSSGAILVEEVTRWLDSTN